MDSSNRYLLLLGMVVDATKKDMNAKQNEAEETIQR